VLVEHNILWLLVGSRTHIRIDEKTRYELNSDDMTEGVNLRKMMQRAFSLNPVVSLMCTLQHRKPTGPL
jgi:hypothetical protein